MGIVLGAAGEILMPPQSEMDLEMAVYRREMVEHDLASFTAESVRDCRPGQRVLLLRDLLPSKALPAQDDLFYEQVIDSVTKALTDLRLRLREDLIKIGVEVLMEEGLLTTSDIHLGKPGKPYSDKAWAQLRGTKNASKVSPSINGLSIAPGQKPGYPFFHPETVYDLQNQNNQLFAHFGINPDGQKSFYATIAEYEPNRRDLLTVLEENLNVAGLNKFMQDILKAMEGIKRLHAEGKVHRDVKAYNIWEGGVWFDNISVIEAEKIADDKFIYGTEEYIPNLYNVYWSEKPNPYFRDIFAFAMSIAEAIALIGGKHSAATTFFEKHKGPKVADMKPEAFMQLVREHFFASVQNEKVLRATGVIEKMILGQGKYTLADALRDLAGILGTKI